MVSFFVVVDGQKVPLKRQRLRGKDGGEVRLGTYELFQQTRNLDNGLGLLGIASYFKSFSAECTPAHAGVLFRLPPLYAKGEGSWPPFDYYTIHPDRLKPITATIVVEQMGGRQTIETGPSGNHYAYSNEHPAWPNAPSIAASFPPAALRGCTAPNPRGAGAVRARRNGGRS